MFHIIHDMEHIIHDMEHWKIYLNKLILFSMNFDNVFTVYHVGRGVFYFRGLFKEN